MAYKATIEILIDVDTFGEACDAVAETMREHMRRHYNVSCFVDWRYSAPADDPRPIEVGPIPAGFDEDSDWPAELAHA